jgi:hypothetical protein
MLPTCTMSVFQYDGTWPLPSLSLTTHPFVLSCLCCSVGPVAVNGTISRAIVGASGTSTIVIASSVPTSVTADLSGITTLVVDSPQGKALYLWDEQGGMGGAG